MSDAIAAHPPAYVVQFSETRAVQAHAGAAHDGPAPGRQPQREEAPADHPAVHGAVHAAHTAYLDGINSNRMERYLPTVTDDVVYLPPASAPIVGKAAVGAWVAGYFEAVRTAWTKTTEELVVQGDLAYEWYRYRVVDTARDSAGNPTGQVTTDEGNGVNIYRRGADGSWRVWRDIWASAGAPAE